MSLKRKLDDNGAPSSSLAPAPKVQLSAFAAARAKSSATSVNDAENSIFDSESEDYTDTRRTSVDVGLGPPEEEGDETDLVDRATEDFHFHNVLLSTWNPGGKSSSRLSVTDDSIKLELQPGENLSFIGAYDILIKAGAVTVYGATLRARPNTYRVYAPASHALPIIECSPVGNAVIEVITIKNELQSIVKLSPLFKRLWNKNKDVSSEIQSLCLNSFQFLRTAEDDPDRRLLYGLLQPPDWQDCMKRVAMNLTTKITPRVLVTGFNGSGKSTFARLLTNFLVTRPAPMSRNNSTHINSNVCWLDLDPAHPEFSPPGQISLVLVNEPVLGPAYTHPYSDRAIGHDVLRAHNIATTTLKEDPTQYLACVENLFACYEATRGDTALIINCPKWAIGEGQETLLELIKRLPCTEAVFMLKGVAPEDQYTRDLPEVPQDTSVFMSLRPPTYEMTARVLDTLRRAGSKSAVHFLSKVDRPSLAFRTAAEFRNMQTMSYFQSLDPVNGVAKWESSALFAREPWLASYDPISPDILGILNSGAQATAENLSTIVDGMVLGLCMLEDDNEAEYAFSRLARTKTDSLPFWPPGVALMAAPPNPDHSHAIGFVYCQTIDAETRSLVLHSPISRDVLEAAYMKTRTGVPKLFLVRGTFDMPAWAYMELDHLRKKFVNNEDQERLCTSTSKNGKRKRESNLSQKMVELTPGHDPIGLEPGETSTDANANADGKHTIPYVAEVGEFDPTGQRWRTRHDIGRR